MTMPFVQLFLFGIVIICDLGSSIYDRYFLNTNDQIGYAAHFGGNKSLFQKLLFQCYRQ